MTEDGRPRGEIAAKLAAAAGEGATAVEAAQLFAESSPETSRNRTLVWQDPVPTAAAGATMTGIEYMEAIVAGEVPPPPNDTAPFTGPKYPIDDDTSFGGTP